MFLEGEGEREREGRQRGRRSIETAGSFLAKLVSGRAYCDATLHK